MINIILCVDADDSSLGQFFSACADETVKIISSASKDINLIILSGSLLNEVILELKICEYQPQSFIFLGYSHGSSDALFSADKPYISVNSKSTILKHHVSYHFACHTGRELGPELIKSGSKAFIGYNNKVQAQNFITIQPEFLYCAISGIKPLIEQVPVVDIYSEMKRQYTESIDKLYKQDYFIASILLENRDALILLGDTTTKV